MKEGKLANMLWIPKEFFITRTRLLRDLKRRLTIRTSSYMLEETTARVAVVSGEKAIGFPRAWAIQNFNHLGFREDKVGIAFQDAECKEWPDSAVFEPGEEYWTGQEEAIEEVLRNYKEPKFDGLLEAKAGSGKTLMGCSVAAKLKQKTLVIVGKDDLANQWHTTLDKFFPGVEPGHVQASTCIWENAGFVTATAQTLYRRLTDPSHKTWAKRFTNSFGFVMFDEAHRFSAQTFELCLQAFNAPYRLALSATFRRKDGLEPLLNWNLKGFHVKAKTEHLTGGYKLVTIPVFFSDEKFRIGKKINFGKLVSSFTKNEQVMREAVRWIETTVSQGRKVLVVSDRIQQLKSIEQMLSVKVGKYYGPGDKKKETKHQVLLATYSKVAEGTDIPELDTVIMTSPKSDVEQCVGRIQRIKEGKKEPLVVDLSCNTPFLNRMRSKRTTIYRKLKFKEVRS